LSPARCEEIIAGDRELIEVDTKMRFIPLNSRDEQDAQAAVRVRHDVPKCVRMNAVGF
jgi:hypothetical protein